MVNGRAAATWASPFFKSNTQFKIYNYEQAYQQHSVIYRYRGIPYNCHNIILIMRNN